MTVLETGRSVHSKLILILPLLAFFMVLHTPCAHADLLSSISDAFKRWGLFQGIEVTGNNSLTLQQNVVDGSETAYENQRWDTGTIERQTSISLSGPIWKEFVFEADLSASGYGQSYSSSIVGYAGHDSQLFFGDLNVNLSGNEFVSFSKTLQGYQFFHAPEDKSYSIQAFYSQEKGLTRNQTIQGNNTSGPYFLNYTPIIDGSEVVKVNEEVQKFGVDYILDYESGQLNFDPVDQPLKIIPDTSVISVSYESYGSGSSPSSLSGFRAEWALDNGDLTLGVTHALQETNSQKSDTVGYQEDVYQGSGSTGPFDTIFRPIIANGTEAIYDGEQKTIEQALVVLVDNVEQVESIDYDSYRSIGRIIFRRAVPPTSLVLIRYFYDLTTNYQQGDTEVTGFDVNYRINKELSLRADYGISKGDIGEPGGNALQANLSYSRPRLNALISWQDVDSTFQYINSAGFQQQAKGTDIGVKWQPLDHVSVYTRLSDLDSSSGYSFGYSTYSGGSNFNLTSSALGVGTADTSTTDETLVNTQRHEYSVNLDFPGWPGLELSRQELDNIGGTSGDSTSCTDQLSATYSPSGKPYSFTGSIYSTNQNYAGTDSSDARGSTTDRYDLSAQYRLGSALSLRASIGNNRSNSTYDDNESTSDTKTLNLRWAPSDKFDINLDHQIAESTGQVSYYSSYSSSGSYSSIGGGTGSYNSSSGTDDEDDETNRYEDTTSQLRFSYRPSMKLSLDLALGRRKYSSGGDVGYLADSDQTTRSLSVNYRANDEWTFNAMYSADRMDYLDEGSGFITNNSTAFSMNYRPEGKPYTASLSLNLQDGASPTYVDFGDAQKMFMVDTALFDVQSSLSYNLSDTSSLQLQAGLSDYESGYSDFNKHSFEIQYERRLSDLAALSVGYRYIRNISDIPSDPRLGYTNLNPPSDNYVANTFMVQFSTNFHSGFGGNAGSGGRLGSFSGYKTGSYGGFNSGYGTSSGQYGTSYSQFENLQNNTSSGSNLPGYGIFEGTGTYQRPSTAPLGEDGGIGGGPGDGDSQHAHDAPTDLPLFGNPDGVSDVQLDPWLTPDQLWDDWGMFMFEDYTLDTDI